MTVSPSAAGGILAAGTYVPPTSVPTRRGAVPVCNGDEDAVTLAIEAGLACLSPDSESGVAPVDVEELLLVTSGGQALAGAQAEVVREALGLPECTRVNVSSGDGLGAVSALLSGLDAIAAGRVARALVIASEMGDGRSIGAGAAAVLIGCSVQPAVWITDVRTEGAVVYDRWQESAAQLAGNEPRYVTHAIERGLAAVLAAADSETVGSLVVTGAPVSAVRSAGIAGKARHVLDFGVAGPLFAIIVGARESGTDFLVAAATGSRTALLRCAAADDTAQRLAGRVVDDIVAGGTVEPAVSPMLSLPSSSPFFERSARELLRLEAARCRSCGHIVFPPTQRPLCAGCHAADFDPHPISRRGSVYTYTVNRFLPVGFGSQMVLILAELDDGYRYWAPASGMAAGDVAIGVRVRLSVRRFTDHGGVPVYAMKFLAERLDPTPVSAAS